MSDFSIIKPQTGFQNAFLSCPADIVIGGSGAGVGKTWAILADPLRDAHVKGFRGVIFRRTATDTTKPGSLWDASVELYLQLPKKPLPNSNSKTWKFQSGAKLKLDGMQYENDCYNYQGTELAFIGFDELTHFTKKQFFYLMSRNRSKCGVLPRVRATCNPQSHGWVKDMVSWYLYPDDYHDETKQGFVRPDRAGVIRYFVANGEEYGDLIWGDSKEEVMEKAPHIFQNTKLLEQLRDSKISPRSLVKSFSFIPGSIFENKELLRANPEYLADLNSQPEQLKLQLLHGCWKMLSGEDELYDYSALQSMFTNDFVAGGEGVKERYLTADIALEGADAFVIGVWDGWRLEHVEVIAKSDGQDVVDILKNLAKKYSVPYNNIVYDSDGVGQFVGGFIKGAKSFHGNGTPIVIKDHKTGEQMKEQYENLRAQCYYRLAHYINEYLIYISSSKYKDQIIKELHATRKRQFDGTKLRLLSKDEIKTKIGGKSPDFADMIAMRVYAELCKTKISRSISSI